MDSLEKQEMGGDLHFRKRHFCILHPLQASKAETPIGQQMAIFIQ